MELLLRRCRKISFRRWISIHSVPRESSAVEEGSQSGGLRSALDLRDPGGDFVAARSRKRRIVYHHGPTNSGKTFGALQRLTEASTGAYAAPLRLLAFEAYEKMNRGGCYTDLVTGQETFRMPFATHVACTVEMLSVSQTYDVVVVDEIQMIADMDRGWAWTRALLGSCTSELHLCGDDSVMELVGSLSKQCGDVVEYHAYTRRSPLSVASESLRGSWKNLQRGDALIVFARDECYRTKAAIESTVKGKKCCVIYGKLPPETKSAQAGLFNSSSGSHDFLIATDAIGLGLNLNIRRVVFTALTKFVGREEKKLEAPEVRQIAGRAGRAGSEYPEGIVTTLFQKDLGSLKRYMGADLNRVSLQAGLVPGDEQFLEHAELSNQESVVDVIEDFLSLAQMDSDYFLCQNRLLDMRDIAILIDDLPFPHMAERIAFTKAPVHMGNPDVKSEFIRLASKFASGHPASLSDYYRHDSHLSVHQICRSYRLLKRLETRYAVLDMYLYLATLLGGRHFGDMELAQQLRAKTVETLREVLASGRRITPPPQMKRNLKRDGTRS